MFGKRNSLNGNLLTIGLDIGYGVTKVVTAEQVITFPSICGHAREIKFRADELSARYPGDQIVDEDGRWFVGDLALNQLPPGGNFVCEDGQPMKLTLGMSFGRGWPKLPLAKCYLESATAKLSTSGSVQAYR